MISSEKKIAGVTSRAVGLLYPAVRQPYHHLEQTLGAEGARGLWELSLRSVEGLSDLLLARGEARAAELDRTGSFVIAEPHTLVSVRAAYQAMRRAGLPVRWLSAAEVRERSQGAGFAGGYAVGTAVNVEVDLVARYVERLLGARET